MGLSRKTLTAEACDSAPGGFLATVLSSDHIAILSESVVIPGAMGCLCDVAPSK